LCIVKGIRQPQKEREIKMMSYTKLFAALAVGTVILFPAFTGPALAEEQGGGPGEEVEGNTYMYRHTWQHRNMAQKGDGRMGEHPGSGRQQGFADENGDGINDLAPDHDGDGVPNGQDPDWVKNKRDGTGYQHGNKLTQGDRRCERSQHRGNKRSQ
jgi:hypothetical protein